MLLSSRGRFCGINIQRQLLPIAEDLITYVTDRKGHDLRYAIDPTKIHEELGWLPETKFADGIKKTIQWYLDHKDWWEEIISGEYLFAQKRETSRKNWRIWADVLMSV